jgi:hypothetical protein
MSFEVVRPPQQYLVQVMPLSTQLPLSGRKRRVRHLGNGEDKKDPLTGTHSKAVLVALETVLEERIQNGNDS